MSFVGIVLGSVSPGRYVLFCMEGGQGAVTEFGIGGDTYEDTVRNLGLHLRHRLGGVIVILREEACWEGT